MHPFVTLALVSFLSGCSNTPSSKTDDPTAVGDCASNPGACDEDGDGFRPSEGDCDDADAAVNPSAVEACNGKDENCNGEVDEGVTQSWYPDADHDGFGDPNAATSACEAPAGFIPNGTDCDDAAAAAFPGATETCDGVDNDCDGTIDNGVTSIWYADTDGDGYGNAASSQVACEAPEGFVTDSTDCDDGSGSVHPGLDEVCDELDNDCDGTVDEGMTTTFWADIDGDGFGNASMPQDACALPTGYSVNATDCDDMQVSSYPGATEVCNDFDDDCDGTIDEPDAADASTWYADTDADGYGNAAVSEAACDQPAGYVTDRTDCNDVQALSYPGNAEVCDSVDNDCNGSVDDGVTNRYYADADADGYGAAAISADACAAPTGYVSDSTDCNDAQALSYPGNAEVCDSIDNDCNGSADDGVTNRYYADADADGYGAAATSADACAAPTGYVSDSTDCNDARALSNPAATEYCNTFDDDCDGTVDEVDSVDASDWYEDYDRDGYGATATLAHQCSPPVGYIPVPGDCIDRGTGAPISYPGADEVCDGLDNDCDGTVDDAPVDGTTYYADADADGFGDAATTASECALPSGYADNDLDCNDTAAGEPVVADVVLGAAGGAGTLTDPLASIQDAIELSNECVLVYPGTYNETLDFGGKSITVTSTGGAAATILDANLTTCSATSPTGCASAVKIASGSNASPTLTGLTITGGSGFTSSTTSSTTCADSSASHSGSTSCTVTTYDVCGGGVYVAGDDPTFVDVIIRDNLLPDFARVSTGRYTQNWMYSYGGGVCVRGGSATFDGATLEGNYADQGGAFYADRSATLSVTEGLVSENSAADGGGINLSGASASFTNSIVACNGATTDGGGIYTETSGSAAFVNTVFFRNTSATGTTRGSQTYIGVSTTIQILNSVVEAASGVPALYGAGTGSLSYNDVSNVSGGGTYAGTLSAGTGSLGVGGNFSGRTSCDGNAYNDNFRLVSGSAVVDAGNPAGAYNDTDGSRNNMGAYGGPGGGW